MKQAFLRGPSFEVNAMRSHLDSSFRESRLRPCGRSMKSVPFCVDRDVQQNFSNVPAEDGYSTQLTGAEKSGEVKVTFTEEREYARHSAV